LRPYRPEPRHCKGTLRKSDSGELTPLQSERSDVSTGRGGPVTARPVSISAFVAGRVRRMSEGSAD
jgi:hypothetical protein